MSKSKILVIVVFSAFIVSSGLGVSGGTVTSSELALQDDSCGDTQTGGTYTYQINADADDIFLSGLWFGGYNPTGTYDVDIEKNGATVASKTITLDSSSENEKKLDYDPSDYSELIQSGDTVTVEINIESGDLYHDSCSSESYSGNFFSYSGIQTQVSVNGGGGYKLIEFSRYRYTPQISQGVSFGDVSRDNVKVGAAAYDNGDDISSCTVNFRDRDGNQFSESGTIDNSFGGSSYASCNHTISSINSYSGFEPGEQIEYDIQFSDPYGTGTTTEEWHRNPNTYLKLENSAGTAQNGVSVTAYQTETGTVASTGEDSTDECSGVTTDSNGWFSCGLAPNGDYDLKVNGIPRINDIDVDSEGTTRVLHYNQYDSSELDKYHYLNVTAVNQTADRLSDANYSVRKAGTSQQFFMTEQNTDDGEIQVPLDPREIYDVEVDTSKFRDDLVFRNTRVPDVIQSGFNQNFLPESTLANSIRYSAGHVVSAQTLVSRPFSNFDVVNITAEKNLSSDFRMVSEVLVKKFEKDDTVSTCTTQPESSTYFFIDEADCAEFGKMNVSQDEWFRLDYRFRIPGPESFGGAGSTNQYNVSDTIIRFDVL